MKTILASLLLIAQLSCLAQDSLRTAPIPAIITNTTILVPADTLVVCSAPYHALNLELRQAVRRFSTASFYLSFKLYEQSLQACEATKQEILTRSNTQAARNVARIDSLTSQLSRAEATTRRIEEQLATATIHSQAVQRTTKQAARRAWLERLGQVAIGMVLGATIAVLITQ